MTTEGLGASHNTYNLQSHIYRHKSDFVCTVRWYPQSWQSGWSFTSSSSCLPITSHLNLTARSVWRRYPCLVHREPYCIVVKSLPGCAGHSVRRRDERGPKSGAVCFAFAQTAVAHSAQMAQRCAQCAERTVTFVFDSAGRGIEPRASRECWLLSVFYGARC